MSWRVILQQEGPPGTAGQCIQFGLAGVSVPGRISVQACDGAAVATASAVFSEIERRVLKLGAAANPCNGPRGMGCMAWQAPSCQNVLVLIIGTIPLDPYYEQIAKDWLSQRSSGTVIPALLPHLTHAQVFGNGAFPTLDKCTAATWGGSTDVLAASAMTAAMLEEKPGVFVSYLRKEASRGAEQIHDALAHAGFRTFLDRFAGTQGRVFPEELSEAMSSMGLVVLLETAGLFRSPWTMWEAGFARRYRLGPVAVNFNGARKIRGKMDRLSIPENPHTGLSSTAIDRIVDFVRNHHIGRAVERRAFYESLVRAAALRRGGDATVVGAGILSLKNSGGAEVGLAMPAGVPGQLRHVRRIMDVPGAGQRILAGEHQHLALRDRDDLRWLARLTNLQLAGSAAVYRVVHQLL